MEIKVGAPHASESEKCPQSECLSYCTNKISSNTHTCSMTDVTLLPGPSSVATDTWWAILVTRGTGGLCLLCLTEAYQPISQGHVHWGLPVRGKLQLVLLLEPSGYQGRGKGGGGGRGLHQLKFMSDTQMFSYN